MTGALGRRLLSIPGVLLAGAACFATAPLWIPLLLAIDALRRRRLASLRCGLFVAWLLACESVGIVAAGALGGARALSRAPREVWDRRDFALQCRWAAALFRGAARLYDLQLDADVAPPGDRPILLMPRHVGIADTLLGALLFSIPHGTRLRYVLKRELLWDPCLDLVGSRLPNHFADRGGGDSEGERRAVAALAADLGKGEGVLIYPEGTRATPERRRRALARARERDDPDRARRVAALRHVLPPRLGGPLALLAACPDADVVLCGHVGLEGATRFTDLWAGRLIGARVEVRTWRRAVASLPDDREAWLLDAWQALDDWVDATLRRRAQRPPAGSEG